jgi:hypothetical protein
MQATLEQSSLDYEQRCSSPLRTVNYAGAVLSGLGDMLELPPRKWQSGEELLRGSRSTQEQTALREILLLIRVSLFRLNFFFRYMRNRIETQTISHDFSFFLRNK